MRTPRPVPAKTPSDDAVAVRRRGRLKGGAEEVDGCASDGDGSGDDDMAIASAMASAKSLDDGSSCSPSSSDPSVSVHQSLSLLELSLSAPESPPSSPRGVLSFDVPPLASVLPFLARFLRCFAEPGDSPPS